MAKTYKRPVAKIAIIKSFLFSGICNLQIDGMGRIRIAKSEKMLNTPLAWKEASVLKQWPPGNKGFQIFSRGLHMKISKNVSTR